MISVKKQKRIFLITLKYFTISNAAIFRKGEFMTEHNLGKWHHVFDGHGKTFTINDKKVAVFNIEGKLFAFDDECPHLAGSLGSGKLEGTARITIGNLMSPTANVLAWIYVMMDPMSKLIR